MRTGGWRTPPARFISGAFCLSVEDEQQCDHQNEKRGRGNQETPKIRTLIAHFGFAAQTDHTSRGTIPARPNSRRCCWHRRCRKRPTLRGADLSRAELGTIRAGS